LSSSAGRIDHAVRFRGVLLEGPAFIVPKSNHDSIALKTTLSLRVHTTPLFSAARTLCENAFGRTAAANRELSLYLSPVFSMASVSSSEISRVSPQQHCQRIQSAHSAHASGQSSQSLDRPFRSFGRTPNF
jgi:hypothetical protein